MITFGVYFFKVFFSQVSVFWSSERYWCVSYLILRLFSLFSPFFSLFYILFSILLTFTLTFFVPRNYLKCVYGRFLILSIFLPVTVSGVSRVALNNWCRWYSLYLRSRISDCVDREGQEPWKRVKKTEGLPEENREVNKEHSAKCKNREKSIQTERIE